MVKIFDLNNVSLKFTNDLQKNISLIKKKYGNNFIIQNNDVSLPSKLYKVTFNYNNMNYYSLIYDMKGEDREQYLFPFKIDFIDTEYKKNNNCYMSNINKTNTISGTEMVETILKLLKILGAKKVTLHDGTRINCHDNEIDLSFFKLIEKGMTFYQRFGFQFAPDEIWLKVKFGTPKNIQSILTKLLSRFRKIKISQLVASYNNILKILFEVIKNQDYENLKIYFIHPVKPYIIPIKKNRSRVANIINEIDFILSKMVDSNKKYLYELFINLFYNDCYSYILLFDYIINNMFYGVVYKKNKVILKESTLFNDIMNIRNSAVEIIL
ncbi:MAG: hypothetical protein Edafosvirus6_7 [Edafosvirus sp.]|uniref:Uncharacterized protein n=1 Tax=Edafosvirus sp. TaxID=2487765 RepID=A0A3G4ZTE4_9VIRU|nr:MAG: hypothetical protein Edafosvirus6_7 [Edafosvirus sp.]